VEKKRKNIFLFGAGAVIDWNGPTTSELTKLVRECGFPLKSSETKITEFIYQRLLNAGYSEEEINFETIINVIEELIVYYSEFNKTKQTPSLLKIFLAENDLSEIFNYSIKGGIRKHGYYLQIPYGVDWNYARSSYFGENPNQFFLQHLLSLILTEINDRVSKYSLSLKIDKRSENSLKFRTWIKNIYKNSVIRLYTLNYDNLFNSLLEEENIDCFDGFFVSNENYSKVDIKRILLDMDSTVCYNLHGSSFWEVLSQSDIQYPEIFKRKGIHLSLNDNVSTIQMEKGKNIIISNIITGYQKVQKSAITPFRHLQSSFDKDCLIADKITIVGYSFGDEHINEAIKTALKFNDKIQIEIIDPDFIKKDMDLKYLENIFPRLDRKDNKTENNIYSYNNGKIKVFTMKFSDFLHNYMNL